MNRTLSTLIALSLGSATISGIAYAKNIDYKASIEALGTSSSDHTVSGRVFNDKNKNGRMEQNEKGIRNVAVSNGKDVTKTNRRGFYKLPAYEGMTVFLTKPAGFDVPVDQQNIPQFFYHHMPNGSPELRFGGLSPTGPLPDAINFPLIKGKKKKHFKMIVIGDTQPYSNNEVGYVRDTLAKEFASMDLEDVEGVIVEGDIMGDDLGLYPRFKEILSVAESPQYYVPGNHDLDFDASTDENSFDTFKREWGPTYYSFDIGDVHFITLDNVQYPCENYDGEHAFCDSGTTYNGVVNEKQMMWLKNDLAHTPKGKLIVLNMHIPIVSFVDAGSNKHQTDNAAHLYKLLEGRPALALSGHTHTLEHFEPGEGERPNLPGVNIPATPFPQIITGAGAGSWWSGDFDQEGVPMSYQRLGAKRGYLVFEFDGNTYTDTFKATGESADKQITIGFLSPTFKDWYTNLLGWIRAGAVDKPPVNINDLDDTKIVTLSEIHETSLTANVWNGSSATRVSLQIDDRQKIVMTRSESTMDPFVLEKQMYIYRYAAESTSGDERAQGFELFGGASFGPGSPRPADEWMHTDNSSHLWQTALPTDLTVGVHTARITAKDKFGREYQETIVFEVRNERPERFFRKWLF